MRIKLIKKFTLLAASAVVISFFSISNLRAQAQSNSETYLYYIMQYTYGILQNVNNLPNYLNGLGQFIISWLTPDNSKTTTQMQANFANLGNLIIQDMKTQNNFQVQLIADAVGQQVSAFTTPINSPTILNLLPTINDLSYASLLGAPPVVKAPNTPYNYIKNASAINISHTMPTRGWQGALNDQQRYLDFYNTTIAVESYNGYVLSNQYADYQNGNAFTTLQNNLITEASNSNWIAQIATEELGKVLRQILMFESQSYVLLSQLIQLQKQILNAHIMTNSLLVLNNGSRESILLSKAQGVQPS